MAPRQPRGRHGGRTSAKDRALEYVKGQILAGTFAGGELISEGETAAALSMSRTPVREAFLRLEADGLLRLYPQRGALVVPVSPDEIRWVMEARSTVEHYAARNLAHCELGVRDAVFEELSAQLQRQRDALACADIPGFLDADRAFHHVTVEACDNPILAQFYSTLRDRQMRMVGKSATGDPQRLAGIIAEHGEIADAIHAGEADRATGAVRRHLLSTLRAIGGTPDRVELLGPDETSSTPPR